MGGTQLRKMNPKLYGAAHLDIATFGHPPSAGLNDKRGRPKARRVFLSTCTHFSPFFKPFLHFSLGKKPKNLKIGSLKGALALFGKD